MCLAFFKKPLSLKKHSFLSPHHVNELPSLPGGFDGNNVKPPKLNMTTLLTSWRLVPLLFTTLEKSKQNKSSIHFSVEKNDQNAQQKCDELPCLPMPHDSLIGLCESDEATRYGLGPYLPTHFDTHCVVYTITMIVSFPQFVTIVVLCALT